MTGPGPPGRGDQRCVVPSGHAVAASVTAMAAVIALVPAGRRRVWWSSAAAVFSIVMGLSRAYIGAHWLSDAVAGVLLGTLCALVTALAVDQIQRRCQGSGAIGRRQGDRRRRGGPPRHAGRGDEGRRQQQRRAAPGAWWASLRWTARRSAGARHECGPDPSRR